MYRNQNCLVFNTYAQSTRYIVGSTWTLLRYTSFLLLIHVVMKNLKKNKEGRYKGRDVGKI